MLDYVCTEVERLTIMTGTISRVPYVEELIFSMLYLSFAELSCLATSPVIYFPWEEV